jgi:hypothetical protein
LIPVPKYKYIMRRRREYLLWGPKWPLGFPLPATHFGHQEGRKEWNKEGSKEVRK